ADPDGTALHRRLDGVAHQVDDHLDQSFLVAQDLRIGAVADPVDVDAGRIGLRAKLAERAGRDRAEPYRPLLHGLQARPQARDVQDAVHHTEQPLGAVRDDGDETFLPWRQRAGDAI